jgi:hypothetical protein
VSGGYFVPEDIAPLLGIPLSEWIDGWVAPTLPGVYQRRWGNCEGGFMYARFDGVFWYASAKTVRRACIESDISSYQKGIDWRGLARDPALCALCDGLAS